MDEFTTVQADLKGPGYQGWWDHILPQLTEEQTANLNLAAASHGISHRTISIVLTRWGFPVTPGQVGHWRRNHVR